MVHATNFPLRDSLRNNTKFLVMFFISFVDLMYTLALICLREANYLRSAKMHT